MTEGRVPDRHSRLVAAGAEVAVEATAAEVVGALQSAGIRAILLKGPSTARWLYDRESTRISIDVDLLIGPADRAAAEAVLARLGFTPFPSNVAGEEVSHAYTWDRGADGIGVDLHLNLPGVGVSSEDAWPILSRDTEKPVVGGLAVEVLPPAGRAMHVALHAAQHGPGFEQPIADLERALDLLPPETWEEAAALALRLEADPLFAAGLDLLEGGRVVLARLNLPERRTVEATLRATTPPDLSLGFHRLAGTAGWRPKLAFVARKVVPPRAWMRSCVPLARRGRLGLAAAYVLRPMSLLRRAGPGFRAWRRAIRKAR
jgi:hypothetical protein